ncbi:hypothetical protein CDIK_4530, partial [Cucumispora dikerogammari]
MSNIPPPNPSPYYTNKPNDPNKINNINNINNTNKINNTNNINNQILPLNTIINIIKQNPTTINTYNSQLKYHIESLNLNELITIMNPESEYYFYLISEEKLKHFYILYINNISDNNTNNINNNNNINISNNNNNKVIIENSLSQLISLIINYSPVTNIGLNKYT